MLFGASFGIVILRSIGFVCFRESSWRRSSQSLTTLLCTGLNHVCG
jgi:hypothetical protein